MPIHKLDARPPSRHSSGVRRVFRIGRAVTLLVARLVLAQVASTLYPRERDLNPAALVRPARPERRERRSVAELLHVLAVDRGCAMTGTARPMTHEACGAAAALAEHLASSLAVQRALEETVAVARRPACVRRAAVDALAMADSHTTTRALERMKAVTVRRVEWEGRPEDHELLRRLVTALSEPAALTRH